MFSNTERLLLSASTAGFPLLAAAQSLYKSCKSCGHRNVNIHAALRTALHRYRSDKNFIAYCKRLFPLPCRVAGVLLED